jgi:ParB family chromosome partitioning protein
MNTTTIANATEYRNLPLALLTESKTNPRRTFEDDSLKELAESIRTQGILSPLLVRPTTEQGFEIVFGARRYRAAQIAEAPTVPVRIKNLTDAEALEAQLIERRLHRPHLLPREGRCPYCQDRCDETQARANQHRLRPATGRQRDVAP